MLLRIYQLQCLLLLTVGIYAAGPTKRYKADWLAIGQKELKDALHAEINENIAKNVIMFLGDGMGVSTITAARIYKGQQKGVDAERFNLSFDTFPHLALIKTYCEDKITPDSAATATAYLSGVKTNKGMLGLDARITYGDCSDKYEQSKVPSILKWSLAKGKSVGVVTTTRVTHATPAGTYAYSPNRDWECDADLPNGTPSRCKDIARQLIEDNPDIQVILGGGRTKFLPIEMTDPEIKTKKGQRKDKKDLTKIWLDYQKSRNRSAEYVWNSEQFNAVDPKKTDYLFGLFEPSHLKYEMKRKETGNKDPTLAQLTEKAIKILQKNKNGFFLLVEGGRIDHGHHDNLAKAALVETMSFDDAIIRSQSLVSIDDTLTVVTADHSHVFNLAGYPSRGVDLLDLIPKEVNESPPLDKKPMTILVYGNGPGYGSPRQNLTNVDTTLDSYVQQAAVPLRSETHSGEDVSVYAIGPMSHLFHGVKEQNFLALAMGYASCVQGDMAHCKTSVASRPYLMSSSLCLLVLNVILNLLLQ